VLLATLTPDSGSTSPPSQRAVKQACGEVGCMLFPGVKQWQRVHTINLSFSAIQRWLRAEEDPRRAVSLYRFFNTTIQLFAPVSQPELRCSWRVRNAAAFHTARGTDREVPHGIPESSFVAPRERKQSRSPGLLQL